MGSRDTRVGEMMNTALRFCVILAAAAALLSPADVLAQKQAYDLVTYMPPGGWKKEVKESSTLYTAVDQKTRSWCQIGIIKSTTSKGSIEQDFASEWQDLIVKSYKVTEAPQMPQTGGVRAAEGWKIRAGSGTFTFENGTAKARLTTMSGFGRCVSIVATTNSDSYAKDIEALLDSVELKKPETASQAEPATQPSAGKNGPTASIIGTWGISASDQSSYKRLHHQTIHI
jgi:hypothetical protein